MNPLANLISQGLVEAILEDAENCLLEEERIYYRLTEEGAKVTKLIQENGHNTVEPN